MSTHAASNEPMLAPIIAMMRFVALVRLLAEFATQVAHTVEDAERLYDPAKIDEYAAHDENSRFLDKFMADQCDSEFDALFDRALLGAQRMGMTERLLAALTTAH